MTAFNEETRRELTAHYVRSGYSQERARLIVDLSCEAVNKATAAIKDAAKLAPDGRAMMAVMELAPKLAAHRMTGISERTHNFAQTMGAHVYGAQIAVPK